MPSDWAQAKAREWLAQQVELDPIWLDTTTDGVQSISRLAALLDSVHDEAWDDGHIAGREKASSTREVQEALKMRDSARADTLAEVRRALLAELRRLEGE